MLSGSKNTMGWLPGGKAEPGNGAQDQSLSQPTNAHPFWGGVGVSKQRSGASPAQQAQQKKQCMFGVAKRMVGRLPPEGGLRLLDPRDLYMHSWEKFRFGRKDLRMVRQVALLGSYCSTWQPQVGPFLPRTH